MNDRESMINIMRGWIGAKQGDKIHNDIIKIYNSMIGHRHYMSITEPWCAATVSACAIACGLTNIVPIECSCGKMIEIAEEKGIWEENDAFIPRMADLIIYSWEDDGKGDCTTGHNHVGLVEYVDGKNIVVIEGNYNSTVKRRTIKINSRYIRGFILPKYREDTKPFYHIAVKGDNVTKLSKMYNVTKDSIIKANQLKSPYWLYAGRKYKIPCK